MQYYSLTKFNQLSFKHIRFVLKKGAYDFHNVCEGYVVKTLTRYACMYALIGGAMATSRCSPFIFIEEEVRFILQSSK